MAKWLKLDTSKNSTSKQSLGKYNFWWKINRDKKNIKLGKNGEKRKTKKKVHIEAQNDL